jgi:hypothetical protein
MTMPLKKTVSDLKLEQYALGDLAPDQAAAVQQELARDAELRVRLAALAESDRQILADYPPERIVPAIRERMRGGGARSGSRRWTQLFAVGLPVAATIVFLFSFFVVRERALPDQTRLKGAATHLSVFRQTAGGAEELQAGAAARRGDLLQLSYTAVAARYGAIFSIDGRGTLTWHLPAGAGGAASPLALQGQVVLPSAYELDDAPSFERFFIVFSDQPFKLGDVEQAARAIARQPAKAERDPLSLPRGLGQASLLLRKQG